MSRLLDILAADQQRLDAQREQPTPEQRAAWAQYLKARAAFDLEAAARAHTELAVVLVMAAMGSGS